LRICGYNYTESNQNPKLEIVLNDWTKQLSNGKTADQMVREMSLSMTDRQIAHQLRAYGFSTTHQAVRSTRIKLDVKKPQSGIINPDRQSISGDEWDIALGRTPISSQEELLKAYNVDTRIWEVIEFNISRYEMMHGAQAVGDSKNWERDGDDWTVVPLNSIKAKLRKRPGIEHALSELESIKATIKSAIPKPIVIKRPHTSGDNMLEMCIPDIHFGKVAWDAQTMHGDYDVAIARDIFQTAVSSLVSRVEPYKFGQVLFVVGNDVFHTDNSNNTTFSGTLLDGDTRYHRTFKIVREVMVDTIESLRSIAPVKVLVIPGNHDRMTSWHLGDSLECWFHRHKDVVIDNAPSARKYHRWGNVLLLFTHGDKGKRADYPTLMATEQAVDWGQTLYREIHTGDRHQTRVEEKFGVRVRIIPSLSAADTWHSENMFVGNLQQAEAFVWNKEQGLLGTAIYTHRNSEK
jgi:hypothetical protein